MDVDGEAGATYAEILWITREQEAKQEGRGWEVRCPLPVDTWCALVLEDGRVPIVTERRYELRCEDEADAIACVAVHVAQRQIYESWKVER